jgi:hypothetical protein
MGPDHEYRRRVAGLMEGSLTSFGGFGRTIGCDAASAAVH